MKKIRTINDITMADWEDIKRRREQGANLDQVGELYGITGTTLAKYAGLRAWIYHGAQTITRCRPSRIYSICARRA